MIRPIATSFVLAAILFGFWNYNASSNELEYWVGGPKIPYHTCGFVSVNRVEQPGVAAGEGFMVDIVRPSDESLIGSKWFNDEDAAKAFVKTQCGGVE